MAQEDSSVLDEICDFLATVNGRAKIIRTLCFSTKLAGALSNDKLAAKRFQIFSSKMSGALSVLALLEDLPTLRNLITYGLGKEEPDKIMAVLGVTGNVVDQIHLPIHKMSWLAENDLICVEKRPWNVASSIFWVVSTHISLIKSIKQICLINESKTLIASESEYTDTVDKLSQKEKAEVVTCIRLCLDLVHAISSLPAGFLWSAKLSTWQIGLIGTITSLLALYGMYLSRSYKK